MSSLAAFDFRRPAPLAPLSAPASERAGEQLPIPLTSFVGRESEIIAIRDLILRPDVRLLTLTGPGGVGKTRLALQILTDLRPAFPGGVWFVELASISDPALVLPTVAAVIGARNPDGRSFVTLLAAAIGDAKTLMTFDNMEHVVDAAPDLAALLIACPGLTLLVTSRVSLRLGGERLFPVSPLSVTESGEGVTLFAHRARSIRPDFTLTDTNLVTVTEICRSLDGLPLAIELAAARTRVLSPAALLLRLDHRLNVLTSGPRDLPDRQRTLRDTIAWSYTLLPQSQQTLFQLLGIFAGGFTIDTAEAIAVPSATEAGSADSLAIDPDAVLDDLSDLVDGGLVRQDEQPGGETRFRMLETVREYALERLEQSGNLAAIRTRHAALFAAAVERANLTEYRSGEVEALRRIGLDQDNIRAALAWSLRSDATVADVDTALRISGGMERFFLTRGHILEGRSWIERALARRAGASDEACALALGALGILTLVHQDTKTSTNVLEESLALWQALDRPIDQVRSLFFVGLHAARLEDPERLAAIIALVTPLQPRIVTSTWRSTKVTLEGLLLRLVGDLDAANRQLEQALAEYTDHGFDWGTAWLQGILSSVALDQGDLPRSLTLRQSSLRTFWEHGDLASVGSVLLDIALLATRLGQPDAAARFLGVSSRIEKATGILITGASFQDETARFETLALLGPEAFAAGQAEGRLLPTSTGVAAALALTPTRPATPSHDGLPSNAPKSRFGLTPRELEILRVLTSGRTTNRDLADILSISPKTAGNHVDNIMAKLGVNSRVAAVAIANRDRLLDPDCAQ